MKISALVATAGLALAGTAIADVDINGGDLTPVASFAIGTPGTYLGTAAGVEYSNITTFTGSAFSHGGAAVQSGNTITTLVADDCTPIGPGGTSVTQVKFSVSNLNSVSVSARARIRFWFADGSGGGPGTYYNNPASVGFSFNAIAFGANSVTTVTGTIGAGLFYMPSNKFWAGVTFDNNTGATGATLAQMNNLGQGIFTPPTVGSSADQAFQTSAAGSFFTTSNPAGTLFNFGGNPAANFGWEFSTIPAPGASALLGLAGLVGLRRRR